MFEIYYLYNIYTIRIVQTNIMNEYLRAFIIGSSYPVFVLYFYAVANYDKKLVNYSYKNYTLIAPLFLGMLNVFGLYLSKIYNLSNNERFLLTALIGAIIVMITIYVTKMYNYTSVNQWIQHDIGLIILYIFVFCIINNLINSNI